MSETDYDTLVALARWGVIEELTGKEVSAAQRGRLVSELAGRVHRGVDEVPMRVSVRTIYRWWQAWRSGGFEALKPARRCDAGVRRIDDQVIDLAVALRREQPARSGAHIAQIVRTILEVDVSDRTVQRLFVDLGLERARLEGRHRAYGRFEALACGELWTADGWDGPALAELDDKHAQLFSFIDDHSRLICHASFFPDVGEWSFQLCLREAINRRGLPQALYLDRGSAQMSLQLKLICARLGIRIIHSKPYQPQGRGKKERHYRTVAEQFGVEVTIAGVQTLAELNAYLSAWIEQSYHHRPNRTTGQTPLKRWIEGPSLLRPTPPADVLHQAFMWTVNRTVTHTRTVSFNGNQYEVDPDLVGRRVQLRYDPTDLTHIQVFDNDQPAGMATPQQIRRHIDPKLHQQTTPEPGPATGVSYLDALLERHAQQLSGHMSYQPPQTNPPNPDPPDPDAGNTGDDSPANDHAGEPSQPQAES